MLIHANASHEDTIQVEQSLWRLHQTFETLEFFEMSTVTPTSFAQLE